VTLGQGIVQAYDVRVEVNDLQFNVNLEDIERVTVVLRIDGDEFLGRAVTKEGAYEIKGARKPPSK
jgi:hypothetical protein